MKRQLTNSVIANCHALSSSFDPGLYNLLICEYIFVSLSIWVINFWCVPEHAIIPSWQKHYSYEFLAPRDSRNELETTEYVLFNKLALVVHNKLHIHIVLP